MLSNVLLTLFSVQFDLLLALCSVVNDDDGDNCDARDDSKKVAEDSVDEGRKGSKGK